MAVTKVCRTCMTEDSNMRELFEPSSQEIITMVEFCTGILLHKENGLPSQMCSNCIADLHIANKFKTNCLDSERAFQELKNVRYSNSNIKNESQREINYGFIKLESCEDNNDDQVSREDVKISNSTNTNESRNTRDTVKKLRIKQEKQAVRTKPSIEAKVKCRRGLNKFKRLYCEQCQMTFSNRKESMEHKKRFHKEEKSWICEVCGKSYAHRSSQIAHMHSHYPARYCCHHCDYSTYNKYDLIKHVRIHTGDKSYKCTQCPAAYHTSSNLRTHVRLLHERTRAHACHVCGKTYYDRATLNRHIDAHNDIKRHVCEVCHSCFTRRCYWKKHLQKQHDIVIPSCRPGRPKAEVLLLERSEKVT